MLVVGPMAGRMMEKRRKVLEELEKGVDGGVTKELGNKKLKELGKAFGRVHGISTVLNLVDRKSVV